MGNPMTDIAVTSGGGSQPTQATAAGLPKPRYNDTLIKYFTIATLFWGIAGFLVGILIAAQMAFPQLNLEPYLTFGRLRPLHTSAVIFAFGGNALLGTSYHVVQRTCRTRLFSDRLG